MHIRRFDSVGAINEEKQSENSKKSLEKQNQTSLDKETRTVHLFIIVIYYTYLYIVSDASTRS